jgi:hypothetical protein
MALLPTAGLSSFLVTGLTAGKSSLSTSIGSAGGSSLDGPAYARLPDLSLHTCHRFRLLGIILFVLNCSFNLFAFPVPQLNFSVIFWLHSEILDKSSLSTPHNFHTHGLNCQLVKWNCRTRRSLQFKHSLATVRRLELKLQRLNSPAYARNMTHSPPRGTKGRGGSGLVADPVDAAHLPLHDGRSFFPIG